MRIKKLQEGNIITKQDNTRVSKPIIPEIIKAKPRQDQLIDLGGEPSTDTRTATERNRDYWHPIKGAKERFKSSMRNGTNPLVGLERTVMPAMAGAALVTTPATVVGGLLGSEAVNNATGGFGQWLEGKVGIPAEVGEYLNPGAVYGGGKGLNVTKNKLVSKFIKGDADLGWNALNRNHWIFNREARTPTNIAMATANRAMPFLSNVEKTPARIAAYKVGRRTKGNASVSLKDIKNNESTYTGSATPEGNNGDRDLLGMHLFKNDPLISKSPWFQKVAQSFRPAKGKGFSHGDRYNQLYPGIENRRYQMQSVVKDSRPLRFRNIEEFNEYSNGIGKLQGKEGDMVIEMPDGFQTFRQPGTNYAGPIDDVGGHVIKIDYNNKGKLTQISQDMWKFNPADYAKRWSGKSIAEGVRATKQAALMDKVGTPFILQQENPIYIGGRRVWDSIKSIPKNPYIRRKPMMQGTLLTMGKGGLIPKGQEGWTSEDIDNPVYSKKKPLSIKEQRKIFIEDRQKQGLENFDKGMKAAYAVARLAPGPLGIATNIIDLVKGNGETGDILAAGNPLVEGIVDYRAKTSGLLNKPWGKDILKFSKSLQIYPIKVFDTIQDAVQLYNTINSKRSGGSLTSDGRRFKFKDSPLVKNSRNLNNKRDMRKKFMKSDRPTYSNNRVRKGQEGLRFTRYDVIERPTLNMDNTFEEYRFPVDNTPTYTIKREETPVDVQQPIIKEEETPIMKRELFNIKPSKGLDEFNKWYDEVEQEDPEAKNYRQFLTKMAEQESGFNSAIQNRAGAPAYGYFQFMQDGKKYNNISAYAGTDVDTFRNNPKLQIKAAIKLAKQFERGFNKQDLELAAQKGYTKFGLLGGAWLAGNGGVRKYLQGLANPSDKHWSKSGSGTDVASRIQMFNF